MNKKGLLFILCLFALPILGFASLPADAKVFNFNDQIREAYNLALSLQLEKAQIACDQEKVANPNNLAVYFIENYIDFFKVFINEDEAEFNLLEAKKESRLRTIKQGDYYSPYYRYIQAEIHLHWALARLKFDQNFIAAKEVRKAFNLLEENQAMFPTFVANKKSLGIMHALIGTIPDSYKFAAKILGMNGTIQQGLSEISQVIRYAKKTDFLFEDETVVMYAFLLLYIGNQSEEAWSVVQNSSLDVKTNPLACFVMANVMMNTGRNDEAINILSQRPKGDQFLEFLYLEYMLGLAKLYKQDRSADQHLLKYVNNFKGQNYIKEAYQKLAWHAILFKDQPSVDYYRKQSLKKGKALTDEDKKALKEAESNIQFHPGLLKARMLFDGAYLAEAEKELNQYKIEDFSDLRSQIEFFYRKGRVAHASEQFDLALKNYQRTLELGTDQVFYFACNAALQTGLIYEELKEYKTAEVMFKKCLSMKPEEYKNSLHQKAKSGLGRIK